MVVVDEEPQRLAVSSSKAQQQGIGCWGGAVLDGETQAVVGEAYQVACGVQPGVEIGTAPQGLAEVAAGAFGHVMDEYHGHLVAAVDLAQEAQQSRDI